MRNTPRSGFSCATDGLLPVLSGRTGGQAASGTQIGGVKIKSTIEADSELVQVWKLMRDSTDMFGKDFMEWLRPLLPII